MKQGQFHISPGSKRHQFFILLFSLSCAILFGCRDPQQPRVCINDHCFQVELAKTPEERARGLMFKKHLDDDGGMLFLFEEENVYPFWMKNTFIPLDILWINSNKEIVFIYKNAQPCITEPCPVIYPGKKAKYVLELHGGISDTIGLIEGDKVSFDLREVKDVW
jgi:hypothetical protein